MLSNQLWALRLQCTFYVSSPLCRHLLCTVVWSCAKRVAVPLRWETSFIHQAEDREWNYLSSSQSSSFNTSQRFYDLDREIILWGHHQAILSHLLSQGLQRSRPIVCIFPFHIINNRTFEIFCFIFKTPNPLFIPGYFLSSPLNEPQDKCLLFIKVQVWWTPCQVTYLADVQEICILPFSRRRCRIIDSFISITQSSFENEILLVLNIDLIDNCRQIFNLMFGFFHLATTYVLSTAKMVKK